MESINEKYIQALCALQEDDFSRDIRLMTSIISLLAPKISQSVLRGCAL